MSKSNRNKTIKLSKSEQNKYAANLVSLNQPVNEDSILNKTICQNFDDAVQNLPEKFVDLLIFDPFFGSGSIAVTAKKLNRKYLGIEVDKYYAYLVEKRLELAGTNKTVQGYEYKTFWERNTIPFDIEKNRILS
jgi:hypothetical protein